METHNSKGWPPWPHTSPPARMQCSTCTGTYKNAKATLTLNHHGTTRARVHLTLCFSTTFDPLSLITSPLLSSPLYKSPWPPLKTSHSSSSGSSTTPLTRRARTWAPYTYVQGLTVERVKETGGLSLISVSHHGQ